MPRQLTKPQKVFLTLLALWLATVALLLFFGAARGTVARGIFRMALGLVALWVFLGGALMQLFREKIRARVLALCGSWPLKFVVFCTLLALLEEAIATLMTNCAPLFGARVGAAYITASANFFDVVLFHSVVVFVPMFVAWAALLSRLDFSPFQVFTLFGLTGFCAEITQGVANLPALPQWIFVYGLMIYLPVYCLPPREAKPPHWWHFPLAILLPIIAAIPVVLLLRVVAPHHPDIHFAPLAP